MWLWLGAGISGCRVLFACVACLCCFVWGLWLLDMFTVVWGLIVLIVSTFVICFVGVWWFGFW